MNGGFDKLNHRIEQTLTERCRLAHSLGLRALSVAGDAGHDHGQGAVAALGVGQRAGEAG